LFNVNSIGDFDFFAISERQPEHCTQQHRKMTRVPTDA